MTAGDLINQALKLIGVLASGESASAEDATDGLMMLNQMMDSWNAESLMVYQTLTESFSLSTQSRTIGPTGDWVTIRPLSIESAFVRYDGLDSPVDVMTAAEYNAIGDKSSVGTPTKVYYDASVPDGTLTFWPVPDKTYTAFISSTKQFAAFPDLTSDVVLPSGYGRAIAFNLALELSPLFGAPVSTAVLKLAADSKGNVKRSNHATPLMTIPLMSNYDIQTQ